MNLRQRILLDVDGVIADFTGFYLDCVHAATGKLFTHADVTEWSIAKALGLSRADRKATELLVGAPGAAFQLAEIPGAVEAVKQIAQLADVYFVTSPWDSNPTWSHDRRAWLMARFGDLGKRVVHTNHKEVVVGDMLIDDKPDNVIRWSLDQRNGVPVLWDHPANRSFNAEAPIRRLSSWDEVLKIVRFES